jgi:hypothetical protein
MNMCKGWQGAWVAFTAEQQQQPLFCRICLGLVHTALLQLAEQCIYSVLLNRWALHNSLLLLLWVGQVLTLQLSTGAPATARCPPADNVRAA